MSDELAAEIREAGFPAEAARIESVTPEEERRFEEWLAVPENAQRWETALQLQQNKETDPEGDDTHGE